DRIRHGFVVPVLAHGVVGIVLVTRRTLPCFTDRK
ncbi:MAG: hypothetical protein ACJAYU_004391, partial [Bradymonadia bacterium]